LEFANLDLRIRSERAQYVPPPDASHLKTVVDWYPFRRADGLYDVYVASAVPLRRIAEFTNWRGGNVSYTARVIAFDSLLNAQWSDSVRVAQHFDILPRGVLAQNQWETVLPPGFYVLTTEIENEAGEKHGVASFDRWLVPYLDSVELDLSPLVIAADVRDADGSSGMFVRNGKVVVPMPGHVFKADQDVAFYHEVYNLERDEAGTCRYRIDYTLYDTKRDQKRTLLSKDLESPERHTFQAGRIPHRLVGKGEYIFEVRTTDLLAHKKRTALAQLKVE
jgi:hypothetical protein